MSRLDVQFLDEGLHRALFDAMPLPVFIVDEEVHVLECNSAAARLMGETRTKRKPQRIGSVLDCLHATETPGGCGRAAACGDCGLRSAVRAAFHGEPVKRREARMQLVQRGKSTEVDLRVSCQPFSYGKSSFVLLVLEGLNN
ncbi:MAG TPA: PAS domain-containing protein [Verrucomicrobiae bacterium]|nr:PAS domain-containing protein [Verrucomicrobiae bacterium]